MKRRGEVDMAGVMMLLSQGDRCNEERSSSTSPTRVFECKTCNRQFPSFQALGGHRTSHKKPRAVGGDGTGGAQGKPRVHGCSVCGLEFAVGQALGGHMRRHRAEVTGSGREKKRVWLDLNLPPIDTFGLEIVEPIPMVGCFH